MNHGPGSNRRHDSSHKRDDKRRSSPPSHDQSSQLYKQMEAKYGTADSKQHHHNQYQPNEPASTVIVRGMSIATNEDELRNTVYRTCGITPTAVKVVRDKMTGETKGFGFIDFDSIESAKQFMESTTGRVYMSNVLVSLDYSHPKHHNQKQANQQAYKDWICETCQSHNFGHRDKCYQCKALKSAGAQEVIMPANQEHVDENKPTVELIVRGLDAATTEETIQRIFAQIAPVKQVRVIRDRITQASRQFAFVEFYTLDEAINAYTVAQQGMQIDEAYVNVTYAKRQHVSSGNNHGGIDSITLANWSSAYNYNPDNNNNNTSSNAHSSANSSTSTAASSASMNGYVYDSNTGYYYHAELNYYYDPNTSYFYDITNGVWLYYDATMQTYTRVDGSTYSAAGYNYQDKTSQHQEAYTHTTPSQHKEVKKEKTIGKGFVPNPQYQRAMLEVEHYMTLVANEKPLEEQRKADAQQQQSNKSHKKKKRKAAEISTSAVDQDPTEPISAIGNKMLKSMGWKEGEGLGKNKDGITAPISVHKREDRAGIGFGASVDISTVRDLSEILPQPGEKYQDLARKKARLRYEQMNAQQNSL